MTQTHSLDDLTAEITYCEKEKAKLKRKIDREKLESDAIRFWKAKFWYLIGSLNGIWLPWGVKQLIQSYPSSIIHNETRVSFSSWNILCEKIALKEDYEIFDTSKNILSYVDFFLF